MKAANVPLHLKTFITAFQIALLTNKRVVGKYYRALQEIHPIFCGWRLRKGSDAIRIKQWLDNRATLLYFSYIH